MLTNFKFKIDGHLVKLYVQVGQYGSSLNASIFNSDKTTFELTVVDTPPSDATDCSISPV